MSLLKRTQTNGVLSLFYIVSVAILAVLIVLFFRNRKKYPIRKRAYGSSIVFAIATSITAFYLTVLVETPESKVTCEMRHFELVTDWSGIVGTWVRAVQTILIGKINLFLYAKRKRKIEGRDPLKPDWYIRNAGMLGNGKNQALFFGGFQAISVIIWAIIAYGAELDCSDPRLDLKYKSLVIIGSLSPFAAMFVTLNKQADLLKLRLEGNLDCAITTISLTVWGLCRAFADDRKYSEIVLIVFTVWLHIVSTIGMPYYYSRDNRASVPRRKLSRIAVELPNMNKSEIPEKLKDVLTGGGTMLTNFLRSARTEYAVEGPEFLLQVLEFQKNHRDAESGFDREKFNEEAKQIYEDYLAPHSRFTINISFAMFELIREPMANPSMTEDSDLARWEALDRIYMEVYNLVCNNSFKRFRENLIDQYDSI
mmetsp:Transcript_16766/g.19001  ORF Transcript_16766/g.19001 Transcript_16766/m.19001 type:complete len:424 (+) Transcript_16766:194-1465(+)